MKKSSLIELVWTNQSNKNKKKQIKQIKIKWFGIKWESGYTAEALGVFYFFVKLIAPSFRWKSRAISSSNGRANCSVSIDVNSSHISAETTTCNDWSWRPRWRINVKTVGCWLRDEIHKILFHHFSPHRLNAQFKRILSFFFQGGKLNCGFNIECKSKIILRRTILVEPHSSK